MKNILIAISLLTSANLIAATKLSKAVAEDKKFFCEQIDKALSEAEADMGLDIKKCLANKSIKTIVPNGEGVVILIGNIDFRSPSRPSFKMKCEMTYSGSRTSANVVNEPICN